ncbi:SpvB/TcaC N-terminal domain-containing protein [Salinisphaera sp. PC39]|uniref:SpvB/TcaC N-terminal domain-containing protein n=1 Tax=Salinisphaera sp. PC39 TaxID=1304156 RepID=UPI003341938C
MSTSIPQQTLSSLSLLIALSLNSALAAVGTTNSNFAVTPDGAASYSIPITVPPGTAGMEPRLQLRYSSQGGDGMLGVGWSLTGLSRITRCPATYVQDNTIDGVDFDANDKLCLNGSRLVAISGNYGESGTEYRTEVEDFIKVKQFGGDLNAANTWFKVHTKNGLIKEYGGNNSSFQVPGKDYNYIWSVSRTMDTSGNYIKYNYSKD